MIVPPAALLDGWELPPVQHLGAKNNQNWVVEADGQRLVLRSSVDYPALDQLYELTLLDRLFAADWPRTPPRTGTWACPVLVDGGSG